MGNDNDDHGVCENGKVLKVLACHEESEDCQKR